MSNKMIEDIEILDEVIDNIDNKELDSAKDKLIVWRDNLKKELEAMELHFTKYEQLDFEPNTTHTVEMLNVTGATVYDPNGLPKDFTSKYTEENN